MSVHKLPNGRWQVKWRVAGKLRAKNFAFKPEAVRFDAEIKAGGVRPTSSRAAVTFRAAVAAWQKRAYPRIAESTRETYDKLLRLHFGPLMPLAMTSVTPTAIDRWIEGLVAARDAHGKGHLRVAFRAELALLSTVLNDFGEHLEEPEGYVSPIRKRHRKAIRIGRPRPKPKDLSELELEQMLAQLVAIDYLGLGHVLRAMAITQYYQALRISEAAAIAWEDVRLDFHEPSRSRLVLKQHAVYLRSKGARARIDPGFKNSGDSSEAAQVKEQPMFPRTFAALAELAKDGRPRLGLVFHGWSGELLRYRQVQYAYDKAFKAAGLPYTSTHVMRHGGTRAVLEASGGDRDVARQQLGNRNDKTVEVYAQRSARALTRFVEAQWNESSPPSSLGGSRLRIAKED